MNNEGIYMSKNYNILVLCAGRRVELINSFIEASKELKLSSNIIAADSSRFSSSLFFSTKNYILPKITSDNYIDSIIKICKIEKISLIVPTIDHDLQILADNKKRIFSETRSLVMISDSNVIKICNDKIQTYFFLKKHGFLTPKIYNLDSLNKGELCFPLFIKPKSGSSSIGSSIVKNLDHLNFLLKNTNEPILQDYARGIEYTIDCFLDFKGNVISVVPRQRIETRNGEISKGLIVKDRTIIDTTKALLSILKPLGQITIQMIKTDLGLEFIEINPRFGGGAPMSIMAGANSCKNLFLILMGKKLVYSENYINNVYFMRYDQTIMVSKEQLEND